MTESSDRVYTLSLTQSEFLSLNYFLGALLGEVPMETSHSGSFEKVAVKNIKAIYIRTEEMVLMDLCPHQAQPPVDMAAVNQAFDRIRQALAEADQAINSQKEV